MLLMLLNNLQWKRREHKKNSDEPTIGEALWSAERENT